MVRDRCTARRVWHRVSTYSRQLRSSCSDILSGVLIAALARKRMIRPAQLASVLTASSRGISYEWYKSLHSADARRSGLKPRSSTGSGSHPESESKPSAEPNARAAGGYRSPAGTREFGSPASGGADRIEGESAIDSGGLFCGRRRQGWERLCDSPAGGSECRSSCRSGREGKPPAVVGQRRS